MKSIFNFKLYLEGIKKIRLVGIIAGIIVLIGNALPPLVSLLESRNQDIMNAISGSEINILTASNFAIPSLTLLFLTPFFFFSMFSFLNKRNESDFYHAIPYKRGCVLFSFLAAIYTWIWGVLLASLLLTGLLWLVCPGFTFAFSVIPQVFGIYAAATLYLGSFFLLAMTLTGTTVSNIAVSAILLFFVRIVGSLVTLILDDIVYILDIAYTPLRFLSMRYWLPATIINSFYDSSSVYKNTGLWIYSFVVLIIVYALATFCYCRRKSESANKSAPNRKLQHVFRCAFTLPLALLTAFAITIDEDITFVFVLFVITLVVYYLYELITTKNIRSTLRATPLLLVPILCSALIIGGCYLTRSAVLEGNYTADEIASVREYRYASLFDFFEGSTNSYEDMVTSEIRVPDREAAELVSKALASAIESCKNSKWFYWDEDSRGAYIEITLQSGRRLGRHLEFARSDYEALLDIIQNSSEYHQAYISLPDSKNIQTIYANLGGEASDADLRRLWETFAKEYNALSDEEKVNFKNEYRANNTSYWYGEDSYYNGVSDSYLTEQLYIDVQGAIGADTFRSTYRIPETFTETRALYFELCKPAQNAMRETLRNYTTGDYDDLITNNQYYSWLSIELRLRSGENTCTTGFYAGSYNFEGPEESISVQLSQKSFERTKQLFEHLLPYLTDTPDNEHCISILFELGYDDQNEDRYVHKLQTAFFGLSDLPDDLLRELTQSENGTDPELFLEVLRMYANNELSEHVNYLSNVSDWDSVFDLYLDYEGGMKLYVETGSSSFRDRFEASRQFCALLLTHLRTEVSDEAPETQLSLSIYDNEGNWINLDASFGLVPFEGEEQEQLQKLADKIGHDYGYGYGYDYEYRY